MLKPALAMTACFLFFSISAFAATPSPEKQTTQANQKAAEGDYEGALSLFENILQKNPDYEPALMGKADVLYWQGNYQGSIDAYAKILELDPDHIGALIGTGKAWLAMGKNKKSQEYFNRAQRIEPKNEEAKSFHEQEGKTRLTINGGYITEPMSYATTAQGEFQEVQIEKEKSYGALLNTTYLNKFNQTGLDTRLSGNYYFLENTRVDAGLSFAPETALFPKQSYTVGLKQTLWSLTPQVQYTFQNFREANLNAVRSALYFAPFSFLKVGGGYEFQNLKFGGTSQNFNNGFGDVQISVLDLLQVRGSYAKVHRGFEAGRTPSPYVNYKANVFGGGFSFNLIPGYSIGFDSLYEKRNNNETFSNYKVWVGYRL
ncbi:MAG: tetratricopeptide repeat protein [Deltaproteobacteria bacterium]|nr:tetratricopeptide repeat protein [Deltaproteobacteria bacterium]